MRKNDFKIFSFLLLCIIILSVVEAVEGIRIYGPSWWAPKVPPAVVPTYIPQFVLISFDGSRSNATWRDIRLFKDEMQASSTPINVTHFINAAYFLTQDTKHLYKAPGKEAGISNIGFSEDLEHIRTRLTEVNMSVADGDEIAPHTTGHFSGKGWTRDEWKEEFDSFTTIMFGLDKIYPDAHLPKLALATSSIVGFRAPYLDKSPGLYEALHYARAQYDTSEVAGGSTWPKKDAEGMWHIPLGMMKLGKNQTNIIAMDYNLYFHDSQAKSTIKKGTPEWQRVYDDTLAAFLGYFEKNYVGNRAPVLIGYHFSQEWNDGVYWQVMKDFARQVCGKPEVRCGTFKELVTYMDENGVPASTKIDDSTKKMTAGANDAVDDVDFDSLQNE